MQLLLKKDKEMGLRKGRGLAKIAKRSLTRAKAILVERIVVFIIEPRMAFRVRLSSEGVNRHFGRPPLFPPKPHVPSPCRGTTGTLRVREKSGIQRM